jgi:(1->4)-alpha-D-glucan 1-alpha-D-glucosylmutase
VISELDADWAAAVEAWGSMNAERRPAELGDDDDYHLYQTLVGAWPIGLAADDAEGLAAFHDRVVQWREKSLREAKLRTSWAAPDEAYEAASRAWLRTLFDPTVSADFLASLIRFVNRIAGAGAVNGVVQAALRCAWPGVPDLYQGAELWDLSLVDPDNRRPVDFELRARLLAVDAGDWASGAIKLQVIAELLAHRRRDPALFTAGALEPLPARGPRADHVLAFRRTLSGRRIDLAVLLQVGQAIETFGQLPLPAWWADTEVRIGDGWRPASTLFAAAPVAVLAHSENTSS